MTPKKKKTPKLDMNPMVDMAFLLVSFFMLTTTFKTTEPLVVERPMARSELKMPETNIAKVTVGEAGEVFFSIDGKFSRKKLLDLIGNRYQISFSESEKENFALTTSIGLPVDELKDYLGLIPDKRKDYPQTGIPCDSIQNQLKDWIIYARLANPKIRIAINADKDAAYDSIDRIVQTLLNLKVYRFNLITELEKKI